LSAHSRVIARSRIDTAKYRVGFTQTVHLSKRNRTVSTANTCTYGFLIKVYYVVIKESNYANSRQ
jgi:hypothetical protein